MKKIFAFILALVVMVQVMPTAFAKQTKSDDEPRYYISMEGLTIGQGMYVEPVCYTFPELDSILTSKLGIETNKSDITTAMVTVAMLKDKGIEYYSTGSISSFYLSKVNNIDKGYVELPDVVAENSGYTSDTTEGNSDSWLGECDYSFMSGWMIVVDDIMLPVGCGQWNAEPNSYARWQFTFYGYGADLGYDTGWGAAPYFTHANKDSLNKLYADINRDNPTFFAVNPEVKASALKVMENLVATQDEVDKAYDALNKAYTTPTQPEMPQDVTGIINDTMAQLASTVTEPTVGTLGGEWSVLGLARGGYYETNSKYFADYYNRVVEYVNATCPSVSLANGALHTVKSTENSRVIIALSAIGKDARQVGEWNLITPFNDFSWITKQGINGPIYALIALDTVGYETEDATIRSKCIDYILNKELAQGGFALSGTTADPDVTAMALQALSNYAKDERVAAAIERAVDALSQIQRNDGGFASWGTVNSESCAQVVAACAALGINPDTDARFIKDGKSAVDGLLNFYLEEKHSFAHTGTTYNAMATDQALYSLIAYKRFTDGKNKLYDMSDVAIIEYDENGFLKINAILSAPAIVSNKAGSEFNVQVSLTGWDNTKDYKLLDAIMMIPSGVKVADVTASGRFEGGKLYYEFEQQTGKLRIVYSDIESFGNISVTGDIFPAEIFTVKLMFEDTFEAEKLNISLGGMSLKLGSDSQDPLMMHIVNTENAMAEVTLKNERDVFAYVLYKGDGIDIISENMQAVAVLVTETAKDTTVAFGNTELMYNAALTEKTGVATYIAIFDTGVSIDELNAVENYTFTKNKTPDELVFGDVNNDGVINAQDALNTVNTWLRKTDAPTKKTILAMNVNCDSRINTFDALGIVDSFVNGTEFIIVTYAGKLTAN